MADVAASHAALMRRARHVLFMHAMRQCCPCVTRRAARSIARKNQQRAKRPPPYHAFGRAASGVQATRANGGSAQGKRGASAMPNGTARSRQRYETTMKMEWESPTIINQNRMHQQQQQ
jgi:hypothetical protein